jgi:hypothetical protein
MSRWRRAFIDWRAFFFYPLAVVLPASMCYAILHYPNHPHGWQLWFMVVLILAMAAWLWRAAREGIYYSDDGVRIQRVFGSTVLEWNDIAEVEGEASGTVGFRTVDGRLVESSVQWMGAVVGRSVSPVLRRKAFDRLIAHLKDRLVSHRTS